MQKENKFFFSFPSESTRAWLLYNQCMGREQPKRGFVKTKAWFHENQSVVT
jgi:hypothetical protein